MPNDPIAVPTGNPPIALPSDAKSWYTSKTLWANILGGASLVLAHFGLSPIDAQTTGAILAVVNFVLRLVTKQPIQW